MRNEKQNSQTKTQQNVPAGHTQEYTAQGQTQNRQPNSQQYHQDQRRDAAGEEGSCGTGCGCGTEKGTEKQEKPKLKEQGGSFRTTQLGADDADTSSSPGIASREAATKKGTPTREDNERDPRYKDQQFNSEEKQIDRDSRENWKSEGGSTVKDTGGTYHK